MSLPAVHGDSTYVKRVVSSLGLDPVITIHPVSKLCPPGLLARIKTPTGVVVLD